MSHTVIIVAAIVVIALTILIFMRKSKKDVQASLSSESSVGLPTNLVQLIVGPNRAIVFDSVMKRLSLGEPTSLNSSFVIATNEDAYQKGRIWLQTGDAMLYWISQKNGMLTLSDKDPVEFNVCPDSGLLRIGDIPVRYFGGFLGLSSRGSTITLQSK